MKAKKWKQYNSTKMSMAQTLLPRYILMFLTKYEVICCQQLNQYWYHKIIPNAVEVISSDIFKNDIKPLIVISDEKVI